MKRLIVFALNGALAKDGMPLDFEMARLLGALNEVVRVAVLSGVDWRHCEAQVLAERAPGHPCHQLTFLPVCGTQLYRYSDHWGRIYARDFSAIQKDKIINAIERCIEMMNFDLGEIWGPLIEDRGSQVTYSGLGQLAPIAEKRKWDPDCNKRRRMKMFLDQFIPEYSVHLGGMTSIDVTKPGLDKGYGIRQLRDNLGIPIQEMLFIGNTFLPGGNDLAAKAAGVQTIGVRDAGETKRVIEAIIAMLKREPHGEPPGDELIPFPTRGDDGVAPAPRGAPPRGRVPAGERHAALAREIRETLARYAELMDVLGRPAFTDAFRVERYLPDLASIGEPFAGLAQRMASLEEALDACERILLSQNPGGQDTSFLASAASA